MAAKKAAKTKSSRLNIDEASKKMIRQWLTGDDAKDAETLQRTFRALRFTRAQWRQAILEAKEQNPKRNGKTIIKARRVSVFNVTAPKTKKLKTRNGYTHLTIAGQAKAAQKDGNKGWTLAKRFYPVGRGTQKLTGGRTYLDLATGYVYRQVLNPAKPAKKAKRRNAADYSPATPIEVTRHYRSGGPGYATRRQKAIQMGQRDLFASDASMEQLLGYLTKNPSVLSVVKKRLGKKFATASATTLKREMKAVVKAELSKRKTKSGKKRNGVLHETTLTECTRNRITGQKTCRTLNGKKRRNGSKDALAAAQLAQFRGYPRDKETRLNVPDGTPEGLYKLGKLVAIYLEGQREPIRPGYRDTWLLADTKGKLHLGTSADRLADALPGALGVVRRVEYAARKPHLGHSQETIFYHDLGEENGKRPTLIADGKGGLVFRGGDYYIRPEGIRN